jgi:hypothetical protein
MRWLECGTLVPERLSICPVCRSADLELVAHAGSGAGMGAIGVDAYHTYQRRRRGAVAATVGTTVLLLIVAVGVALALKDLPPAAGETGADAGPAPLLVGLRVVFFLLAINPLVLAGVSLVFGLWSYRLWHRLLTGHHGETGLSLLEVLGGRPRRP